MVVEIKPRLRRAFRRVVAAITTASILMPMATPAFAWKPKTHVYLAEVAMRDAIDDGKVTIYQTDYETGRVLGPLGEFEVNPAIVAALRANPAQYLAGVVGPDAYPDMMTGQQVIHPGTNLSLPGDPSQNEPPSAPGTDAWLTHMWRLAYGRENPNLTAIRSSLDQGPLRRLAPGTTQTPAIRAFVAGYTTHAAGDMFMHTFINHYAGGDFAVAPDPRNAIKHLVLEGYIGKRTPDTHAEVSIDGVEDFIYRYMVRAEPGSVLEQRLLQGAGTSTSIPAIFSTLRNGLQRDVDNYERERLSRRGPSRVAYATANGPEAEYKRAWIADIDEGLQAWPAVSHQISLALNYNPAVEGTDFVGAKTIASDYVKDHLLSMTGVPDSVIATVRFIAGVIDAILPDIMIAPLEELKKDLLDWLCREATGMSVAELETYLAHPETVFDRVMNQPGGGYGGVEATLIDLAGVNRDILKIDDSGALDMNKRFVVDRFAPAFNTVQMTKMMFLSERGMNDLLAALRAKGLTVPAPPSAPGHYENAMLGFLTSMDGDNRWQGPAAGGLARPFFLATGSADGWRNLFMRQIGERPDWLGSTETAAPVGAPDDVGFETIGSWAARVDSADYNGEVGRQVVVTMTFRNDAGEARSFWDVLTRPVRADLGLEGAQSVPQLRMDYVHTEEAQLPAWHYLKSTPIPPRGRIQVRFAFDVGDVDRQSLAESITIHEQQPGRLVPTRTVDAAARTFPIPRMTGTTKGSATDSLATGGAAAAFTAAPYLSWRADAYSIAQDGSAGVMLSVMNPTDGIKRVHNSGYSFWLVGADGTEYRSDGNVYGESTDDQLRTGLSMERDEMVHVAYRFARVPSGFTPSRLSLRDNGREVLGLPLTTLPSERPSGVADAEMWTGAELPNAGQGRFDATLGDFRQRADGSWAATLTVAVRGQSPQRFVVNDFGASLYGSDGQVRHRAGTLYAPDEGDVLYGVSTVTVEPGAPAQVKLVFPTAVGINPERYRLWEANGPSTLGWVSPQ